MAPNATLRLILKVWSPHSKGLRFKELPMRSETARLRPSYGKASAEDGLTFIARAALELDVSVLQPPRNKELKLFRRTK